MAVAIRLTDIKLALLRDAHVNIIDTHDGCIRTLNISDQAVLGEYFDSSVDASCLFILENEEIRICKPLTGQLECFALPARIAKVIRSNRAMTLLAGPRLLITDGPSITVVDLRTHVSIQGRLPGLCRVIAAGLWCHFRSLAADVLVDCEPHTPAFIFSTHQNGFGSMTNIKQAKLEPVYIAVVVDGQVKTFNPSVTFETSIAQAEHLYFRGRPSWDSFVTAADREVQWWKRKQCEQVWVLPGKVKSILLKDAQSCMVLDAAGKWYHLHTKSPLASVLDPPSADAPWAIFRNVEGNWLWIQAQDDAAVTKPITFPDTQTPAPSAVVRQLITRCHAVSNQISTYEAEIAHAETLINASLSYQAGGHPYDLEATLGLQPLDQSSGLTPSIKTNTPAASIPKRNMKPPSRPTASFAYECNAARLPNGMLELVVHILWTSTDSMRPRSISLSLCSRASTSNIAYLDDQQRATATLYLPQPCSNREALLLDASFDDRRQQYRLGPCHIPAFNDLPLKFEPHADVLPTCTLQPVTATQSLQLKTTLESYGFQPAPTTVLNPELRFWVPCAGCPLTDAWVGFAVSHGSDKQQPITVYNSTSAVMSWMATILPPQLQPQPTLSRIDRKVKHLVDKLCATKRWSELDVEQSIVSKMLLDETKQLSL
eukprot:TRINITY_DN12326_c3_g1_i8.p1 TRINITY_DN12326_c3_g1~~TRINITY_DN12326_c3_g1_i8.p1  ORF type:complete len:657 (+),score=46.05 TRINITY_DN12326_c3_g1_i8:1326-3296(+)